MKPTPKPKIGNGDVPQHVLCVVQTTTLRLSPLVAIVLRSSCRLQLNRRPEMDVSPSESTI